MGLLGVFSGCPNFLRQVVGLLRDSTTPHKPFLMADRLTQRVQIHNT